MSGVEVAGLVLGTIPLLLASLQHYERVVGTVTIFFHFRNEISSAIRELEREHVLFEQAIHLLLAPITMDEELREMMADTNSPLWQDLDICEDMRRNLGRAYPSYLRTVQDIQNIMIDIATKLEDVHGVRTIQQHGLKALIAQVRMDALLDFDNSTTQFGISRRLKYAMGRNRMKKLLKELREHIQSLDRIQDKAVKIAVATESFKATRRSSTRLLAPHVRKNANRLHEALSQAFCSNHTSHSTALLLESRIAKTPWTGENNKNRLQSPIVNNRTDRFQLSVLHSPLLLPSKWLDFQVRVLESPVQGGQTRYVSSSS